MAQHLSSLVRSTPTSKWNNGVSWPIDSGHGCIGCSEENFWDDGPFYSPLSAAPLPGIESTAVTKWDLLPHVPFDDVEVREQVSALNPSATVLPVSVTTGEGLDTWCELLTQRIEARRATSGVS